MVIDALLNDPIVRINRHQKNQDHEIWQGRIDNRDVYLVKPMTYMNSSGSVIANICKQELVSPLQILVIYDDVDLPLGGLRIRQQGSSGGHRGVKNLIEALKSQDFNRIRVGINGLERKQYETSEYVLSNFEIMEESLLVEMLGVARNAAIMAVRSGINAAMNYYNKKNNE